MSGSYPSTPRLDALLARLGATLRRGVWSYGLGTTVAAGAGWLLFMYLADRFLHLPAAIRLVHLGALVLAVVYVLWRTLLRPSRALPDRGGLALLAQRALPAGDRAADPFVNALQLPHHVAPDAAAAPLVRRSIEHAEDATSRADLAEVTDPRTPRTRLALGALAAVVTTATLAAQPAMARIFGARMLGANVPWPRRTTLFVEVPTGQAGLNVDATDPEVIRVRAARGTDIPVFVRAEGEVPDVVTLEFEASGASVEVAPGGPASFRTVVPSVQEDTVVRAFGGDDDRGVPRIEIEVLQPPDLRALAFAVTPPAYSGLEAETVTGVTSVRALAGSTVEVHVAPDPVDAAGIARAFPSDATIELEEGLFPLALGPVAEGAEPPDVRSLRFRRTVNDSLRFRFELRDASGLTNPDPALFGIEVYEDSAPEILVLSPTRVDRVAVLGSVVPVRALVRDDFRVEGVELVQYDGITEDRLGTRPIALERVDDDGSRRGARDAALASSLVEVNELGTDGPLAEGEVVALRIAALDGREPEPGRTESAHITVRIVSQDNYLQRQRDALRIAADTLGRLRDRVDEAEIDLAELEASTLGDEAEAPSGASLQGALSAARRLQGDLGAFTRDLAEIAEGHVYSRIDDRAGALEERLLELSASPDVRGFSADVWRVLGDDLAAGRLGSPTTAGDLVRLVALGVEASGVRADGWVEALAASRANADDVEGARETLGRARAELAGVRQVLERLTGELGEWDSMQSIQARARDILNSSKNLQERLQKQAEQK